jgi:methyl-accepting chemotaxis protein
VLVLDKSTLEAPLSSLLMTQLGLALLVLVGSILAISWLVSLLLGPSPRCPRPWPASPTVTAI